MTRRNYLGLIGAGLSASALGIGDPAPEPDASDEDRARRMKWWHDARFGMFIHWGLYSVVGRHEWVMEEEAIPVAEYEQLAKRFTPKPNAARACCPQIASTGIERSSAPCNNAMSNASASSDVPYVSATALSP